MLLSDTLKTGLSVLHMSARLVSLHLTVKVNHIRVIAHYLESDTPNLS